MSARIFLSDPEGAGSSELCLSDCCDINDTNHPRGEQSLFQCSYPLFKVKKKIKSLVSTTFARLDGIVLARNSIDFLARAQQ